MIEQIIFACGFAFTAAISPGPLLAFIMAGVLRRGWKNTLPVCLAPLISDIPVAVLVLFFLSNLSEMVNRLLRGAGGVFLLYLGLMIFLRPKGDGKEIEKPEHSKPGTLFQAVMINILNPNPYIGWSLVLGPAFLEAWHRNPASGIALLASFYLTIVVMLAAIIVLLGTTGLLNPRVRKVMIYASAGVLASLGVYQITVSMMV